MPEIVKGYLASKGASNVRQTAGASEKEIAIVGDMPGESAPLEIDISSTDAATAFHDLKSNACDIGMASRKVKREEADELQSVAGDLTSSAAEHVLGIDAVAVIVNQSNPVAVLSLDQLASLFSGDIPDWSKVNGAPGPVHVLARDEQSGAWEYFDGIVMHPRGKSLVKNATRQESGAKLSEAVAADPAAIGFVGYADLGAGSKALALSARGRPAIKPDKESIGSRDYVLSRPLYLYTPADPKNAEVKSFLTYATGADSTPVLEKLGFARFDPQKAAKPRLVENPPPLQIKQLSSDPAVRRSEAIDEIRARSRVDADREHAIRSGAVNSVNPQ